MLGVAGGMVTTEAGDFFISFGMVRGGGEGAICIINVDGGVFGLWLCVERGWKG